MVLCFFVAAVVSKIDYQEPEVEVPGSGQNHDSCKSSSRI